ncbi:hypothetical protein BJ944DRAFT_270077 [Cunninghamella echinulata]|nr:hypothetical protein BJ944DRAFT_270077 [Cunninghamella echinulata]
MDYEDLSFAYISNEQLDIEVLKKEIANSKTKNNINQVDIVKETKNKTKDKEQETKYKTWVTIMLIIISIILIMGFMISSTTITSLFVDNYLLDLLEIYDHYFLTMISYLHFYYQQIMNKLISYVKEILPN